MKAIPILIFLIPFFFILILSPQISPFIYSTEPSVTRPHRASCATSSMVEKAQSSPARLASLAATVAASVTKAGFQEHFYPYRQDF